MHVLQVNSYHYLRGGDSRYMFGVTDELRARGIRTSQFGMSHPKNHPSEQSCHFAEHVDYPSLLGRRSLTSVLRVLRSSIHNGDARRRLAALVTQTRPDVAHLHSIMHHLTASVVLELRRRSIPIVWTLHDYKSVCPTTRLLRNGEPCELCARGRFHLATRHRCKRGSLGASAITTLELYLHRWWRVYEEADVLVAPSSFLRDAVLRMGLRPRRIEVLPNFVDLRTNHPSTARGSYLLYVGRLSHEKGLPTLLEASGRVPGLELRIAGTGELESELRRQIRERDWSHVHLEGHCNEDDLRRLYERAIAVVVPSEWYENCPMVVLEAFARARPIVASRLGGLVDLVEDGTTGRLIRPGDVEAWARVFSEIRDSREDWHQMGSRARKVAEARFGADGHMERLLELYRDALDRH